MHCPHFLRPAYAAIGSCHFLMTSACCVLSNFEFDSHRDLYSLEVQRARPKDFVEVLEPRSLCAELRLVLWLCGVPRLGQQTIIRGILRKTSGRTRGGIWVNGDPTSVLGLRWSFSCSTSTDESRLSFMSPIAQVVLDCKSLKFLLLSPANPGNFLASSTSSTRRIPIPCETSLHTLLPISSFPSPSNLINDKDWSRRHQIPTNDDAGWRGILTPGRLWLTWEWGGNCSSPASFAACWPESIRRQCKGRKLTAVSSQIPSGKPPTPLYCFPSPWRANPTTKPAFREGKGTSHHVIQQFMMPESHLG